MKRVIQLLCMTLLITSLGWSPSDRTPEQRRAIEHGAELCLTFHVTDSLGNPVTNANVNARFQFLTVTPNHTVEGNTDTNGMCTVKGLCGQRVLCQFSKEGYYATEFDQKVSSRNPDVKGGKWQPWNPTIEITLKEKRNPIPLITKNVNFVFPKKGEAFGFDFEKGDFVKPYGTGEQADLLFMCTIEERGGIFDLKAELFISATQDDEGTIVKAKDTWSQFVFDYEAQEDGYLPKYHLIYDRTPSKILQKTELADTEYLTFRSRIIRDREGKVISSNYGMITGITYGRVNTRSEDAKVSFTYYFNPTPNDCNLEFDANKNLFGNDSRNRISVP